MSSHEPEPDDEDTGPLPVGRSSVPSADPQGTRYDAPLSVNPRPVHRDRRPVVLIGVATAAVVGLGALAYAFWPSSDPSDTTPASPTTTPAENRQEAETRLMELLPAGYAQDACEPVVPAKGALAQISCTRNDDPGGPLTATYTLVKDSTALKERFDGVVSGSAVVNCPGNIQSPGPWRRNATPDQGAGTLVCGFQQSRPTVAWTTDADLMVSEIQSGPQGPNLVQLYTWWSSHS
ncbi:hypothetical protein ACNUDN_23930 [Mycobacterium sp. smrl_JER01]|uniref:hypothetical protein n=1 Tax=Mycobacterium sp. smrl_JER01 TaxID=3402633 RepID=UPI003AC0264E